MLFCPQEMLNGLYGTIQSTILARREATEHSNNFIKQGIRKLGPNVTEKAVSRQQKEDLHELVNRAVELNIFTEIQGGNYNHFKNFECDRLENLNASSLWINKHKKNITWGVRAR